MAINLRELSVALEEQTGSDSIPTMEEHYRVRDFVDGRYVERDMLQCVWPGCKVRRRDPASMWLHVHMSGAHGLSFGSKDIHEVATESANRGGSDG